MRASQTFDNLITQVKASNLNFQIQLSPFSALISLKKSLVKDKCGVSLVPPIRHPPILHHHDSVLHQNQELTDKIIDLEKGIRNLTSANRETLTDCEKSYKTATSLKNVLDVKNESILAKEDVYTKQIQSLRLENFLLRESIEKSGEVQKKVDDILNETKKDLNKKQKLLLELNKKNGSLEKKIKDLETENKKIDINKNAKDEEIHELKEKLFKLPQLISKQTNSTNTSPIPFFSSATQTDMIMSHPGLLLLDTQIMMKKDNPKCSHYGCFIRQPKSPPTEFAISEYIPGPSRICLLLIPTKISVTCIEAINASTAANLASTAAQESTLYVYALMNVV